MLLHSCSQYGHIRGASSGLILFYLLSELEASKMRWALTAMAATGIWPQGSDLLVVVQASRRACARIPARTIEDLELQPFGALET